MKKFYIIVLSALLVLGFSLQARAESSGTSYSGKVYTEQQVFTVVYNNGSTDVSSGDVVIFDTSATAGTTLGTYVTTTTTADNKYVFGVADETIEAGTVGRVCIRGPHKVNLEAAGSYAAGDILAASSTEKRAEEYATSDGTQGGYLGIALEAWSSGVLQIWAWIRPETHK